MEPRLPAHLEVAGLIRRVAAAGGFAAVLHKGDREAGTIIVALQENGANPRAYERMPTPNGAREWTRIEGQSIDNVMEFGSYLSRRSASDPDLWIVELDVPKGERFIGLTGTQA